MEGNDHTSQNLGGLSGTLEQSHSGPYLTHTHTHTHVHLRTVTTARHVPKRPVTYASYSLQCVVALVLALVLTCGLTLHIDLYVMWMTDQHLLGVIMPLPCYLFHPNQCTAK